jgi:hypothetical protein
MTQADDATRSISLIREEMRFELDILHNRINALISAEAFLTIAFTMALGNNATERVALILSSVGLMLALLAWPSTSTSIRIINEWNTLLTETLAGSGDKTRTMWRPSIFSIGPKSTDLTHRRGMIFVRSIPVLFVVAWCILGGIAIGWI